jgi:hypothetical protein
VDDTTAPSSIAGEQRDERRRADDTDCRQYGGRQRDATHGGERRLEPAVEQDEDERRGASSIGKLEIVERDPCNPLAAGENPEQQEEQRQRHTEPLARARQDRARGQQPSHGEEEKCRGAWLSGERLGHDTSSDRRTV